MIPPIDLFTSYAQFGRERRIPLRDPAAAAVFATHVTAEILRAISSDILVYGQRAQNMFEALVVSLGHYKVLKTEDAGRVFPRDRYRVPDFRVILPDGAQWLIEVKNVYVKNPSSQRTRFSSAYLERLEAYAAAMGCPLKLALYWARWRIWTLVSPGELTTEGGKRVIGMTAAIQANEMAALGDRTIGTRPPLRLKFVADRSKPRNVSEAGEVTLTFVDWEVYCDTIEIRDPIEKAIALILIQYGDWEERGPLPVMSLGGELDGLEFAWSPRERLNEGFEMIGTLSTMFSGYYASQTVGESGVLQTEAEMLPDWFAPLTKSAQPSMVLPLWKFIQQPLRQSTPTK